MRPSGAQRKRSGLKYAVLGLVAEQPGYGYSLIKRLEQVIGDAYRLQDSAVYVALSQLKSDGLVRQVERQAVGSSRRSDRVLYAATPEGKQAVAEWLGTSDGSAEPARSELVRKLALAEQEHAKGLLHGIETAQLDCMDIIEAVTRRQHDHRSEQQTRWEGEIERLVHSYGVRMVNAQLEWLRDAHTVLSRFADEASAQEGG